MSEIDPDLRKFLMENGHTLLRVMPDGHIAGIHKFIFTYGLLTRLDWFSYHSRWCYQEPLDAARALLTWDGVGDPPGPWIKQKTPVERHNPLMFDIISRNEFGREFAKPKEILDMKAIWREDEKQPS